MDRTTPEGLTKASNVARSNPGALLWSSLPCTAGCSWWAINEKRFKGRQQRRKRIREFLSILRSWVKVAAVVKDLGGYLVWEWPRGTWLWKHPALRTIMQEYGLDAAVFDGCAFGLLSTSGRNKGKPFKKQWKLATDCSSLLQALSGKGCPGGA